MGPKEFHKGDFDRGTFVVYLFFHSVCLNFLKPDSCLFMKKNKDQKSLGKYTVIPNILKASPYIMVDKRSYKLAHCENKCLVE